MITRETIEGREATCVFMKEDMTPCSPDEAELVKVTFDDDGSTAWLRPAPEEVGEKQRLHS